MQSYEKYLNALAAMILIGTGVSGCQTAQPSPTMTASPEPTASPTPVLPTATATTPPTAKPIAFYRGIPDSLEEATEITNPFEDRAEFDSIMDTLWDERPTSWPPDMSPIRLNYYVTSAPFLRGVKIIETPVFEKIGWRGAVLLKFTYPGEGEIYLAAFYCWNPNGSTGLFIGEIGGAASDADSRFYLEDSFAAIQAGAPRSINLFGLDQGIGFAHILFEEQPGLEQAIQAWDDNDDNAPPDLRRFILPYHGFCCKNP